MNTTAAMVLEEDCTILLRRTFLGKDICAFGEDGFGKHGRNERAMWFTVNACHVDLTVATDDEITGHVYISLDGYDAGTTGLILTDLNFEIRIRQLLVAEGIDPDVLSWPDGVERQGEDFVVMDIDVPLLLGW